jgi:L-fuculose-phosphate aldolase
VPGDPITPDDRRALVDAARAVAESGLVVGSSGNLSLRRGDRVLITPRRAELRAIGPADCVEIALADGALSPGHASDSEPSSEEGLHRAVYAAAPDATAVVHTHSHFATVLGTLVDELPPIHYGITAFGGPVRVVPFAVFGSPELAASVGAAFADRSAALLANHGAVVAAGSIGRAVDLAVQLEWLASVAYHAALAGTPALLSGEDLDATLEQSRRLRYALTEPA